MTDTHPLAATARRAADLLKQADGLLITAGAGMGVDSGLPDFRGDEGFWQAYPALGQRRVRFSEIASPSTFREDPRLAWGFYGHRLNLYRGTVPHDGFRILQRWASQMPSGAFVFTSNVDGQFQTAGFAADRVVECHGSIHYLQCLEACGPDIWSASAFHPRIDDAACRIVSPLPVCPHCGGLARPNILMFGDWGWEDWRTAEQNRRLRNWLDTAKHPVVVELGAGTAIATVRRFGQESGHPLIRINPTQASVIDKQDVGLQLGALAGLEAIDAALANMADFSV